MAKIWIIIVFSQGVKARAVGFVHPVVHHKVFIQETVPEKEPLPGAVIAVQTLGDFLGFNPHCHIIMTDGCFYGEKGMFRVAPPLELKKLETIFRHKVFKMGL